MSEAVTWPQQNRDEWRQQFEMTLADRMRKCIDVADWSVQQVADHFGVTRGTVSTWINGRVEPRILTVRAWAHLFNVPVSWLLDGEWPEGWRWPELSAQEAERARRDSNPQPSDP